MRPTPIKDGFFYFMAIGDRCNKLTQTSEIYRVEYGIKEKRFKQKIDVICDCGESSSIDYYRFGNGTQKGCRYCGFENGGRKTHGLGKHPLYSKWSDMLKRCYNPKVDRHSCYGALGIKVCDEWRRDFKNFHDWCLNNGYSKDLELDRIDVHSDYSPLNCRFITHAEQAFNKRNTFYVTYLSDRYCLMQWLRHVGHEVSYRKIWEAISKNGKSFEYCIEKYNLPLPNKNNKGYSPFSTFKTNKNDT